MIDPTNDYVSVYKGADGDWYWRRVDGDNGREVSRGSEGYVNVSYAQEAAATYNSDIGDIRVQPGPV